MYAKENTDKSITQLVYILIGDIAGYVGQSEIQTKKETEYVWWEMWLEMSLYTVRQLKISRFMEIGLGKVNKKKLIRAIENMVLAMV